MKRILLLVVVTLCMAASTNAQSKKYALFEHFTQASCGPCATQNPAFELIRDANMGSVHHVAYHTSWPGVDPMNSINPAEVASRVTYYNVGGVPSMQLLGAFWEGQPTGVSSDLISDATCETAPIRLRATDVKGADGTHEVTIIIEETGDLVGNNLMLRVAVIEKDIAYASPPGNNGERDFPNVFREMLTGNGQAYVPTGAETEQTFTYSYTEKDAYQSDELYILAWMQDDASKIVVNSGSSIDANWQYVNQSSKAAAGSGPHVFASEFIGDVETGEIVVSVETDAPEDWSSEISVAGENYGTMATAQLGASSADIALTVNPGTTAAIAKYYVTVANSDFPDDPVTTLTYIVMSNVTDIILDHGGVASQWNPAYTRGLTLAGNTGYGVLPLTSLKSFWDDGLFEEVKNIYDNVSWTFPGLRAEEVGILSQFLDNGGNLFVNGQDVGWDAFENADNGANAEVRQFYTDYLSATFVNDGSAANSVLDWSGDVVFGDPGSSSIINVYGGANIYPDVFTPIEPALPLYHYNGNEANVGALRVEENGHKIVYVGVDMGMIADENVRLAVVQISHDWFAGILSNVEFDQQIKEALGQSYPNPTKSYMSIPLQDLAKDASIIITDVAGRILKTNTVRAGQTNFDVDVKDMNAGSYFYFLMTDEGQSVPQKFQVID